MQCRSCGTQLPEKAAYCPTCGALTPYAISESGASPYDLTMASASSGAPPHTPATDYGSPPYGVPPQNSYEPLNPYEPPLRPPPPPPPKNKWVLGWLVFVVLGGVIVGYVGFRGLVSSHGNQPANVPSVTATTTQTPQDIYKQATSGTPVLDDPLSQNSKVYNWNEGTVIVDGTQIGRCTFTGGAFHVIANARYFDNCNPAFSPSNDFAFQVQMTIIKGDAGGMQFRINQVGRYVFVIFQDGSYEHFRYESGSHIFTTLRSGSSSAIKTGLNQSNLIAVLAHANTIDLYVNMHYVTRAVDSIYKAGSLGVSAFSTGNLTEVEFRNAKAWTLS
jgi:hypothetical protein